ncbi:hypothetical protein L209DRAFT_467223 [Thermothelomyces heterothallicus CBS 203.75]
MQASRHESPENTGGKRSLSILDAPARLKRARKTRSVKRSFNVLRIKRFPPTTALYLGTDGGIRSHGLARLACRAAHPAVPLSDPLAHETGAKQPSRPLPARHLVVHAATTSEEARIAKSKEDGWEYRSVYRPWTDGSPGGISSNKVTTAGCSGTPGRYYRAYRRFETVKPTPDTPGGPRRGGNQVRSTRVSTRDGP